jgi:hypothetical protein
VPNAEPPRPPKALLHADVDFTVEERAELNGAAELWSIQTSRLAVIQIVYDLDYADEAAIKAHRSEGHLLVARLESWMKVVVDWEKDEMVDDPSCTYVDADHNAHLLGIVTPAGGIHNPWKRRLDIGFVMDRLITSEPPDLVPGEGRPRLRQVALHEFGHVLGISHIQTMNAIMFPAAIPAWAVCLKVADLSAFCDVTECGTTRMYPCE